MPTISDIAKIAGVSKTTVSRVLNSKKYVSLELQERVRTVADQLGYIPNGNAINLSTGKTNMLGIILPVNDYCYDELVNSILHHAKEKNYRIMLLPTYYETIAEESYFELFKKKIVDGLVLTSTNTPEKILNNLKDYGKVISVEKLKDSAIPMIYPDRKAGYQAVFREIKSKNLSEVIFTIEREPTLSRSSRNKIQVFKEYFETPVENQDYFIGLKSYDDGYTWAKQLFRTRQVPQVIYTTADQIAAGIAKALQEQNIYHMQDYQLVGEGNTPYSQSMGFSSLDFQLNKIGKAVVDFMLSEQEVVNTAYQPEVIFRSHL
ncbi:LacI family DNA-binding transcriptional regulator [Enterococcus sp. LJL120]